jgi:hypothetical protein
MAYHSQLLDLIHRTKILALAKILALTKILALKIFVPRFYAVARQKNRCVSRFYAAQKSMCPSPFALAPYRINFA